MKHSKIFAVVVFLLSLCAFYGSWNAYVFDQKEFARRKSLPAIEQTYNFGNVKKINDYFDETSAISNSQGWDEKRKIAKEVLVSVKGYRGLERLKVTSYAVMNNGLIYSNCKLILAPGSDYHVNTIGPMHNGTFAVSWGIKPWSYESSFGIFFIGLLCLLFSIMLFSDYCKYKKSGQSS